MDEADQHCCLLCAQRSVTSGSPILCVSERAELAENDQNAGTKWVVTDKKDWKVVICPKCASVQYEAKLNDSLTGARRNVRDSSLVLIGAITFCAVAATGTLKY